MKAISIVTRSDPHHSSALENTENRDMTSNTTHLSSEPKKLPTANTKKLLMSWSIKSIKKPPLARKLAIPACFAAPGIFYAQIIWLLYDSNTSENNSIIYMLGIATFFIGLLFSSISRQRTTYNYRIYADKGEKDYCLYFPEYSGRIFKGIVLFLVLACVGVAVYIGSLLMLFLGPAGVILGAGGKLLTWEPPTPVHVPSLPWTEHKFVTVDRKYRIVVTHREDPTVGFEARFPNNELMEQYLAFLRTVLPADVRYNEEVWKW